MSRPPSSAPDPAPLPPVRRSGLVAMVGRSNVGKSTLMNSLLGEAQLGLLDTPGLHRPQNRLGQLMNAAARGAVDDADVVLFVTALQHKGDTFSVSPGDRTLLADLGADKPTILVLNKVDQVKPRSAMLPLLQELSALRDFAAIVPLSALRKDGLGILLDEVAPRLPEREALWPDDDLTDRPVRFFVAEFVRAEILHVARQEVPYGVTVVVDSYVETAKMPRISATIHVDRDTHRPILLGRGGERLRDIGIAARARVEALLGHRIHLELFIRVTPAPLSTVPAPSSPSSDAPTPARARSSTAWCGRSSPSSTTSPASRATATTPTPTSAGATTPSSTPAASTPRATTR
ncbi:MAG: GTPase Era [Myxococcales bacterium]|nr:MAG: GTPase Era [Myxococcales bacterium]